MQIIGGFFKLLRARDEETQASSKVGLLKAIARLSAEYSRTPGPFFAGEQLSLADIFAWPFTARLGVLVALRGFAVPETPEFAGFHAYEAAMRLRASVRATLFEDVWLSAFRQMAE